MPGSFGGTESDQPESILKPYWRRRRNALPDAWRLDIGDRRPWGLALSGGGVRSATFCFGLIESLAKGGIFHQFDLLSTVSGGGYIGATIGKLYNDCAPPSPTDDDNAARSVEQALACPDGRPFTEWLRANGRYLIPNGINDSLFAIASFLRALIGIHVELAVLSTLVASVLIAFDLSMWYLANHIYAGIGAEPAEVGSQHVAPDLLAFVTRWPTPWVLLVIPAFLCTVYCCAFWMAPSRGISTVRKYGLTTLFALGGIALFATSQKWDEVWPGKSILPVSGLVAGIAMFLLAGWVTGFLCVAFERVETPEAGAKVRNRLTRRLTTWLRIGFLIVLFGLIDYVAWLMATPGQLEHEWLAGPLMIVAVALRAAVPWVANLHKSLTPGFRRVAFGAIGLAGVLLALVLLLFWVSLAHRAVMAGLFPDPPARNGFAPNFWWATQYWVWVSSPAWLYAFLSFRNLEFLNRSSLSSFYQARLVRSYLGAGNPLRFRCNPLSITPITENNVAYVDDHDDVPMKHYAPHANGGPVHVLNVCINQTWDPQADWRNYSRDIFNRDRKGTLMTVGPDGMLMYGKRAAIDCQCEPPRPNALTLGGWMAISGAAVAPGLGASTSMGLSALLTLSGIRLGYWWDSSTSSAADASHNGMPERRHVTGKYGQLLDELTGRFSGTAFQDWYLSDGGHFENTGAYALLRERCEIIVLADCGADPRYAFGDLEDLVRKARIDLHAEITFLRPRRSSFLTEECVFGSLNDLASDESQACLALARITYRGAREEHGYLVLVKPNICQTLSADLVNFKADNPLFPQEPTTDQMFSEAQWESYHELGRALGAKLDLNNLKNVRRFACDNFVDDDGAFQVRDPATGQSRLIYSVRRVSSRIASTGVVSATVSFGAITSLGLGTLQFLQKQTLGEDAAVKQSDAVRKLADQFGEMVPPRQEKAAGAVAEKSAQVGKMATALLRFDSEFCSESGLTVFQKSPLIRMIVNGTKDACRIDPSVHAACAQLIDDNKLPGKCLLTTPRDTCEPAYWIRDYRVPWQPNVPQAPRPNCVGSLPQARMQPSQPDASRMVCRGKTIYVQLYGSVLRDSMSRYSAAWQTLGASVPPVQDVWESARRAGRKLPVPYAKPTVLFSKADDSDRRCADALGEAVGGRIPWDVKALPERYPGSAGIIEVWIPSADRGGP